MHSVQNSSASWGLSYTYIRSAVARSPRLQNNRPTRSTHSKTIQYDLLYFGRSVGFVLPLITVVCSVYPYIYRLVYFPDAPMGVY